MERTKVRADPRTDASCLLSGRFHPPARCAEAEATVW